MPLAEQGPIRKRTVRQRSVVYDEEVESGAHRGRCSRLDLCRTATAYVGGDSDTPG